MSPPTLTTATDQSAQLPTEEPWHILAKERVLAKLKTTVHGIDDSEATRRIAQYGENRIPGKPKPSPIYLFLRQFTSPFVLVLILIAAVVLALGKKLDAGVIFGIVVLNSLIGFYHEKRAEAALEKLREVLTPRCRVRRAGKVVEIAVYSLVPGDILLISQGDKIPADARLIVAKSLSVNESLLTGESLPERKETKALPKNHLPIPDRKNMIFAGTLVTEGTGEAAVTATGAATELGKIAEAVREAPEPPSLFERRLKVLGHWLIIGVFFVAALFLLIGLVKQESFLTMFLASSAMSVSLIPEGLPMVVTLALAVGVTRMAQRRAVVRRLASVETLGAVTTICTDKTGTLTKNEMTVRKIITPKQTYEVTGTGFSPQGTFTVGDKIIDPENAPDLLHILTAMSLNNDAELAPQIGDHTEVALLVAAAKAGLAKDALAVNSPRLDVLPFDSTIGFMATLHGGKNGHTVFVKGAPETVIGLCQLSDREAKEYLAKTDHFARDALRVLAVATKTVGGDTTLSADELNNLTFLGLVAMEDPPRDEARAAVAEAGAAGVRVIMLTGDNIHTARAIARKVGITAGENQSAEGEIIDRMDESELNRFVAKTHVFARVSPLQKLRIVKALKARGEVVAVTGDGINDAPALAQADIGIAMGEEGTDVAREAAKIVLQDDNFASIIAAIEEGRTIYNNIQRVILYLLSTSLGEALTIVVGFAMGLPLPLLPLQILWINFVTDGFAGLPLALEPVKQRVMQHPPLNPKEPIINRESWIRIAIVGMVMAIGGLWLFSSFLSEGEERARTITFVFLVAVQLFNILNVRSKFDSVLTMNLLNNRVLIPALTLAFMMMIVVVYVPGIRDTFELVPLTLTELAVAILPASLVVAAIEARKFFCKVKNYSYPSSLEATKTNT